MNEKQEKAIIENALRLLRKGKYELSGDEALVFHQCFSYLIEKLKKLDQPLPIPQEVKPVIQEPEQKSQKKKGKE